MREPKSSVQSEPAVRKFTWEQLSQLNERHNAHVAVRGKVREKPCQKQYMARQRSPLHVTSVVLARARVSSPTAGVRRERFHREASWRSGAAADGGRERRHCSL